MRAEQQLSVNIGGDFFQIACNDTDVIQELRELLSPWFMEGQGLPGFKISVPEPGNKMWVLLGSEGNVLARSTDRSAVVRALLRHLAALAAPQHQETQRVGMSAFTGPSGVVLVDSRLLNAQPPIERALTRSQLAIVDSPFLEVAIEGDPMVSAIAASEPASNYTDDGHVHPVSVEGSIQGLLWAASPDAAEVTPGQVAQALASVARTGTHAERIDFGIAWCEKVPVHLVVPWDKGSVLRTAEELLHSV